MEAQKTYSSDMVNWLASGERGISSNTMFTHLTGINALRQWRMDVPHDPDDLRRCRLLLEQVPELAARFPLMRDVSPEWARLVNIWPELCAAMDAEVPDWRAGLSRAAQKTFVMIQNAIHGRERVKG